MTWVTADNTESIKVFEIELNQDGEDLLFIMMKRLKTGQLTAFAYNFSVNHSLSPTFISSSKSGSTKLDAEKFKKIFQKVYFDLEGEKIIYDDFYSREETGQGDNFQQVPQDQSLKFEHYVQICISKHNGEFTQRGFSLPNRYLLQGKRSIIYKGVPLLVLVFIHSRRSSLLWSQGSSAWTS